MKRHLAVLTPNALLQILKGKKTIESRFSQKKIPPFGEIEIGDIVYLKPPGKEIAGRFRVRKVLEFQGLDSDDWNMIRRRWGKKVSLGSLQDDEKYFSSHKNAKYGTLIFIDQVEQFITSPIRVAKKDLRGWMVLK